MDTKLINLYKIEKVNVDKAKEKGLIDNNDCSLYNAIQKIYLKGLEKYLLDKVDLKKYDNMLENSECEILSLPDEKKSYYQQISTLNFKYIFIRNNMYVEKLSSEVLNFFIDKINKNDFSIDNQVEDIIEHTYKQVISKNFINGKYIENATILYDAEFGNSENYSAKCDDLVLVIQIADRDTNMTRKEYIQYLRKRIDIINKVQRILPFYDRPLVQTSVFVCYISFPIYLSRISNLNRNSISCRELRPGIEKDLRDSPVLESDEAVLDSSDCSANTFVSIELEMR